MASRAYTDHFLAVGTDVQAILDAQDQLQAAAGAPSASAAPWGAGALNRAAAVALVSAWEAYIEQVAIEAVAALRPSGPLGSWAALHASIKAQTGSLHQPNVQNVRMLLAGAIGLADVTASWVWTGVTQGQAHEKLEQAIRARNRVAHGINPRPLLDTPYLADLGAFLDELARRTDAEIRTFLMATYGIEPWTL